MSKVLPIAVFREVKQALTQLNPNDVREEAARPLDIGLVASSPETLWRMERYFCPPHLSQGRRAQVARMLHRVGPANGPSRFDLEIYDEQLLAPEHAVAFSPADPERTVRAVIRRRQDLWLPLARSIYPFRKPVVHRIIQKVSQENALFSLVSALPDVLPSVLALPWALGEWASDTAFLTVNQIRMGFLIAGASDRDVGYRDQKGVIASIFTSAFGWRALARELVGKIPFGAGLLPKAAVAYAGTYVVGLSMERLYSLGYAYTRLERRAAYEDAFVRGKEVAQGLLEGLRRREAV